MRKEKLKLELLIERETVEQLPKLQEVIDRCLEGKPVGFFEKRRLRAIKQLLDNVKEAVKSEQRNQTR